jgi:hypothetical protein
MNEVIQFRIAIEADAKRIRLEDAIQLGIDADDSAGLIVVGKRPTGAILVSPKIRRIGDDGIDRSAGKCRQHGETIAMNDAGRNRPLLSYCIVRIVIG